MSRLNDIDDRTQGEVDDDNKFELREENEIVSIGDEFDELFVRTYRKWSEKEQMWEKSINFTNHFKEDVWPSEIKQFIINKITAIRDEVVGEKKQELLIHINDYDLKHIRKENRKIGHNDYRQEIIEIFNKHLK